MQKAISSYRVCIEAKGPGRMPAHQALVLKTNTWQPVHPGPSFYKFILLTTLADAL